MPARRAAIGCMLNRLILLTAGNDPKLAELFARAELKRGSCAAPARRHVGGLGDIGGKSAGCAARSDPAAPAKMLVFMQLFARRRIILTQCGPIDLVTLYPRQLK